MSKWCSIVLVLVIATAVGVGSLYAADTPPQKSEGKRPSAEQMFKRLTGDESGKTELTLEKYVNNPRNKDDAAKDRAKQGFARMDTDKNGTVSLEEFKKYYEQRAGAGKKGGGKKGGGKRKGG
jgi:hypothetical protein